MLRPIERDILISRSSEKAVLYDGLAISYIEPNFICVCNPKKHACIDDVNKLLGQLYKFQYEQHCNLSSIQISLNMELRLCLIVPIKNDCESPLGAVMECIGLCVCLLNDSGLGCLNG